MLLNKMYTPNIYLFLLALIYAVILQILSLVLAGKKKLFSVQRPLLFIFLLALLIRFIPATFFPFGSAYDITAFRWAAERIINREDIYYSVNVRHFFAFFPTFGLLLSWFIKLSRSFGIPFLILEKLPIIIFDSLIAALILKISKSFKYALIYVFSPISIIMGAYGGQFDSLPLFFLLLALFLLSYKNYFRGYVLLGLGTIVKPWPIIFTPIFFLKEKSIVKKLLMIFGFLIPVILILFLYQSVVDKPNIRNLFLLIPMYDSGLGWWGFSIVLRKIFEVVNLQTVLHIKPLQILGNCAKILVIFIILVVDKYNKTEDLFLLAKWTILIIYIFALGIQAHYLTWIFPFALITKDNFLKYYLLLFGGYYLFFGVLGGLNLNFKPPYTPNFINPFYVFILWLFFVAWGLKEIRAALRNYIFAQ